MLQVIPTPKVIGLQQGSKQMNPDELTSVSDSGDKSAGSNLNAACSGLTEARLMDGPSNERS
ncbi:hypothetical protein DVQ33_16845 [Yersinia enterocolitica]|nr:hypothetical protein [Yersinia enterocolitica]EKN5910125.1 hypothetical protein [Yersinia enterocolitica]EKN5920049.1 hypothetical protein [Yersinia enterocolitica]EKN5933611.1 hypothetical protein [Yersinia enterocolitica]EKN5941315.1 hypothetical protein [Yersinia enterocolitica]